jgi:hypothetical protein
MCRVENEALRETVEKLRKAAYPLFPAPNNNTNTNSSSSSNDEVQRQLQARLAQAQSENEALQVIVSPSVSCEDSVPVSVYC